MKLLYIELKHTGHSKRKKLRKVVCIKSEKKENRVFVPASNKTRRITIWQKHSCELSSEYSKEHFSRLLKGKRKIPPPQ